MKPQRLQWTPQLVNQFWEAHAQTELTSFNFSTMAGRTLLNIIHHLLPRDGEILDFGAGDGYLVQLLCQRGFNAAAYEPYSRIDSLTQVPIDSHCFLGVIDKSISRTFDLVIMSEVIEHVIDEELNSTLNTLSALTKIGGKLIVTTPNNEDLELGMCYCPVSNLLFHRWQHVRSFTDSSLSEMLSNFGFQEIVTHRLSFDLALEEAAKEIEFASEHIKVDSLPDYILNIINNQKALIGGQSNLLYVGEKI